MRAVRTGWRVLVCATACVLVWAGSFDDHVWANHDNKACTLDGTSVMAFGAYDPMSNGHLDSQGQVSYRCYNTNAGGGDNDGRSSGNGGGPLTVQISLSQGGAGTFQRRMQGARDVLRYNLYTDAQRTIIWGDGTGGSANYSQKAQPNNKVETIPVFGRVFGAQDVGASQYLDNLVVTLNF